MNRDAIISAHNISIGYSKNRKQETNALYKSLSFELYPGELTCLLGTNGAGKSTLLRTLTGLQAPLSGEVLLNSKSISQYTEQEVSTTIGLVLTDKTTAGGFTVSELVSMGRYPYTGFFGNLSKKDHQIVEKAMNDVCIVHKASSYVAELSDGERQKVMIAKALAQECPIIILDEPTAFLDIVNRIEIMNLLRHLAVTQNKTILLSTHDIELALTLADRLWLLARDKGLLCGITEDIILSSDSINDYIGNGNIIFDKQAGRFLSRLKTKDIVYLEAEGNLYHWARNFLMRKGYQLSETNDANLSISIIDTDKINVRMNNKEELLYSFDQLNSWLNEIE